MPITKVWFSFSGRVSRRTWWLATILPYLGLMVVAGFVDELLGTPDPASGGGVVEAIVLLALLWPLLAGHAKRCHDRGRSAWFILINLIPVIGGLWFLVELGFLSGTVGGNRFGSDPRTAAARQAGAAASPRSGPPMQVELGPSRSSALTARPTRRFSSGADTGISRAAYVRSRAPRG